MLHEILRTICKMTETELLEAMNDLLTRYGLHPEMVKGETKKEGWTDSSGVFHPYTYTYNRGSNGFVYSAGEIPVMLVAHLDTVHSTIPANIFYDQEQRVMWSPQGIGGDDRCGVAAIINILNSGYRPHILFTCGEETGGKGAREFVNWCKKFNLTDRLKYIIELDRKGTNDAVYYRCDNKEFEEYVTKFGWKTNTGSFSDISVLCPGIKIAGVNLSVGYFSQHTTSEYIDLKVVGNTIARVKKMLEDIPEKSFEFVEKKYDYKKYGGYYRGYEDFYEDFGNPLLPKPKYNKYNKEKASKDGAVKNKREEWVEHGVIFTREKDKITTKVPRVDDYGYSYYDVTVFRNTGRHRKPKEIANYKEYSLIEDKGKGAVKDDRVLRVDSEGNTLVKGEWPL